MKVIEQSSGVTSLFNMTNDSLYISDLRFAKDALRVYFEEKKGTFYESKLYYIRVIILYRIKLS